MNRIYRLVFNHALRLWQVASELVQSPRGGTTGGRGAAVGTLPPLRFAMYVALGFVMTVPAFAQAVDQGRILVDRSAPGTQRPTVVEAPNGTPVVNITTPSAAGVSRNNYSQFDVGTQGVILNNSRTNADTQLGGGIEGNPWLARGTARVATAGMLGITARMLINRDTGNPEGSARGIAAQSLHIDAGIVDNANGRMGAGESARVKAGLLTNTDGTITAENALTVDVRLLQGQGGTLGTNGALTLTGSTLNLRDGTTFGTDVRIDSDRLTTAGGTLTASLRAQAESLGINYVVQQPGLR